MQKNNATALEYFIYQSKLFVLRIVTWSYNCFIRFFIDLVKPFHCAQTNYDYIEIITWKKT